MISSFSRLAAFLSALSVVQFSVSSPLAGFPMDASIISRDVSRRAVPAAPHFVVYQYVHAFQVDPGRRLTGFAEMLGYLARLVPRPLPLFQAITSCKSSFCLNVNLELMCTFASAMSFLLSTGAADQATEWASLTDDDRTTIKTAYSAAGISLVVSAFGSSEYRQYSA